MSVTFDTTLDALVKGVPWLAHGLPLSEIGEQHWSVLTQDLPLPVAVIREPALRNNLRWMRAFTEASCISLAPHGKTTMSPDLFAMQLAEGAWGITLATMQQVRVARQARIRRIIFANQLIAPHDISYVLRELNADPEFEFYILVDSEAGVERIARAASAAGLRNPVRALLELGQPGGRAGCRDLATAGDVARAVRRAAPYLELHGVECYEGLNGSGEDGIRRVHEVLEFSVETARTLDAQRLFDGDEVVLTAGGSAYFDIACNVLSNGPFSRPRRVVLRSGCYLLHDGEHYAAHFERIRQRSPIASRVSGTLVNALEVWAYVTSVPETTRAIVGAGRRDLGFDAGMPVPLLHFRPGCDERPRALSRDWKIAGLNDQHAHLQVPHGADIAVGDMLALGVSHPCTTLDKWQLVYLVDDEYIVQSAVRTFF